MAISTNTLEVLWVRNSGATQLSGCGLVCHEAAAIWLPEVRREGFLGGSLTSLRERAGWGIDHCPQGAFS